MAIPGFNAENSVHRSKRHYQSAGAFGESGGPVRPAVGYAECMDVCAAAGISWDSCLAICAILLPGGPGEPTPGGVLNPLGKYAGIPWEGVPGEGPWPPDTGDPFTFDPWGNPIPEPFPPGGGATVPWWQYGGVGGSSGTVAALALLDLAAIAYLVHQVYVATEAGGSAPPSGPVATSGPVCGGRLPASPPPAKGWATSAAHWSISSCAAAIDDAMQNAATYCASLNSMCSIGSCKVSGTTCKSLPVADSVSNQTHLFWCGARVHYHCACYCV